MFSIIHNKKNATDQVVLESDAHILIFEGWICQTRSCYDIFERIG
jgi:hypothetical protein